MEDVLCQRCGTAGGKKKKGMHNKLGNGRGERVVFSAHPIHIRTNTHCSTWYALVNVQQNII
jgi:hypothetical protein